MVRRRHQLAVQRVRGATPCEVLWFLSHVPNARDVLHAGEHFVHPGTKRGYTCSHVFPNVADRLCPQHSTARPVPQRAFSGGPLYLTYPVAKGLCWTVLFPTFHNANCNGHHAAFLPAFPTEPRGDGRQHNARMKLNPEYREMYWARHNWTHQRVALFFVSCKST